ncbi:MAG TPA: IclR family transcriptional regulator [Burkholderiaceae bacterium]|nr:IclR family transcriptional regulator [Burkholderiaceae bacterium]
MPKPSTVRSSRAPRAGGTALRLARSAASAATVTPLPASSSERSLRLLQCVAAAERAISLAELAERLELPKPTLHRLCTQLVAQGFLARDLDEKSYSAGAALRALAFDTLNRGTTRGLRHDVLTRLVDEVGETCNFTTLDGAQIVYLDRVEARWPLRLTLDVGSHVPLHCTSSGKLFLATLPEAQREALLAKLELPALTANTITTVKALREECAAIARAGYSTDREEFIAGLIAVAVPVLGAAGAIRAAVAMHAPTARLSLEQAKKQLPRPGAAARELSALL